MTLSGTLKSLGSSLLVFDVQPFKYEYRIGFETLVVRTLNQWASYVGYIFKPRVYVYA